ncbi:MAG: hypothetical protein RIA64_01300 [Rhodospirillales bacterium]
MTDKIPPMAFTWDQESRSMRARDRRAERFFEHGKTYRLAIREGRSQVSHDHYFACIEEVWRNLPDEQAERFPSSKHLRKHLLIKCGYHHLTEIPCEVSEVAERVAARIRVKDEYALVLVQGGVVREYTAQSQSKESMRPKVFQKSKQDVLEAGAMMIGVSVEDLVRNQGRAA